MNIDLIYQGKNYNFDLRKDVNIKNVHDLASKLINKDSSSFELLYKNTILSEYQNITLLKEITKDDNNISIIITTKDKINMLFSDKIKKLKMNEELNQLKNTPNINGLKLMLNTPLTSPINSKNKSINLSIDIVKNKKIIKSIDYISENKVFEEVYNSKENEIYLLMNTLSEKIKEYDDVLYKKFKNNGKINNNELSLYENSIFEFKDKQITFLKNLINYFNVNETDYLYGNISLNDFYIDLKQYNNPKEFIMPNKDNKKDKVLNKNNKKKKKGKTKEEIFLRNNNDFKQLPLLPNNIKGNRYFLSQKNNTINSDDLNENNRDLEDKIDILKEKKFNIENKNFKNKKLIKDKKPGLLNKTENRGHIINSNIFKNNAINDNENNDNNNRKQYNINKAISLCNTNDNTNTSQNTTLQGKIAKASIINRKSKESKYNLLSKSKTLVQNKRLNTIINSNNKINALFEGAEHNLDVISNNSSDMGESNKESKDDLNRIGEENTDYKITSYNTKIKNKKIGTNMFDFLI